ncbi:MAG: hypothetical protein IIY21_08265 [Clostridiales bacterium]|nr:hypothetical protein [Clostridiales bacterium]
MIIRQLVNGLWNVIADGYIYGNYHSESFDGDNRMTTFTVCYSFKTNRITKEREYFNITCNAIGKDNERFIKLAKKEKTRILVMGTSVKDPTDDNSLDAYVSVWTIIPIGIISQMWEQYLGLISRDKQLESALQTNYSYVTDERAEDHMI